MGTRTDLDEDDVLDYATLSELRADEDGDGPLDHPCPLCGPDRRSEYNQTRPVLRTWKPGPGFITYCCARCEAKGYAHADVEELLPPRPRMVVPPPVRPPRPNEPLRLAYVEQFWVNAVPVLPANVVAYFRSRGIALDDTPPGVLRWHQGRACILARYSDPATGELKGVWRRPIDGDKPMALGPMGGCVIRLWPQIGKRLVIGEGVETTLAAATRITHRGLPLRPAWATGCAGNMRRFPVLDGVEQLVILVDNDASGTGQKAAEECAHRWRDAGCEVIRLIPQTPGTDFNDLVRP